MKIIRVLNTNAVLTKDKDKNEVILLGAGIGFKQKPGGTVDESKIEKQFILKDKKQVSQFEKLVNEIPREYILTAEEIITIAQNGTNLKLNNSIHISLADHIHTAVENLKLGITVPNDLLLDIRGYYSFEYSVGLQGLDLIEKTFGCRLPEDEAGFIAMHIINAEYGSENTNVKKTISFVKDVNDYILNELGVKVDVNSLSYYRYITHLKFFAKRVMKGKQYEDQNEEILGALIKKYLKEYDCSCKVAAYIKEKYGYVTNMDELIYLTVHLAHITRDADE